MSSGAGIATSLLPLGSGAYQASAHTDTTNNSAGFVPSRMPQTRTARENFVHSAGSQADCAAVGGLQVTLVGWKDLGCDAAASAQEAIDSVAAASIADKACARQCADGGVAR
jgi:hypothetical protein